MVNILNKLKLNIKTQIKMGKGNLIRTIVRSIFVLLSVLSFMVLLCSLYQDIDILIFGNEEGFIVALILTLWIRLGILAIFLYSIFTISKTINVSAIKIYNFSIATFLVVFILINLVFILLEILHTYWPGIINIDHPNCSCGNNTIIYNIIFISMSVTGIYLKNSWRCIRKFIRRGKGSKFWAPTFMMTGRFV